MLRTTGFPHSKFLQHSEHDWKVSNTSQYNLADGNCSRSQAVVSENERLCQETGERTDKYKTQVERKFDERISDVDYWGKEIDRQIAGLLISIDKLVNLKTRLKNALECCKDPAMACQKALMQRDKRLGVDMVQDRPQREIQKYLILLEDVMAIFDKAIEQIEDQLITCRAVKHRLQRDATDKQVALEIDIHASGCRPENVATRGFKFDPSLLIPEKNVLTIAEWERATRHNIQKAEQERKISTDIGPRVEEMLDQAYNDLVKQHRYVLEALKDRIKELSDAQKKLEERLVRVQKEINELEIALVKLEQSVDLKVPVLELAANQMEGRRYRPRNELCRDNVDLELEKEVRQLNLSMTQLREQIAESKDMLRKLEQTRLSLQKDIEVKKNSILIDQVQCLNIFAVVAHIRH